MARTKKIETEATVQTVASTVTASSNKVIVMLNQPQGVTFRLYKRGQEYRRVEINGNAVRLKGLKAGILRNGAYGMTVIDKQDWDEIVAQYGMTPLFTNKLIFASSDQQSAEAQASEQASIKSGYEPVDVEATATSPNE